MAALKRKSSEALDPSAKKPLKMKKGKDAQPLKTKKGKDAKNSDKKKLDGKKKSDPKPIAITFPEEGKVEWNTIKKQSKMLTEARKQKKLKNSYDLIQEAKKKFELFRNRKCKGAERDELVMECTELMKGLLSEKAKSHDVARLIQWLLKLGSKEVKNIVVDEIINDVVTLAKCKYSSHIVKNIVVTCDSSVRRKIIGKFTGNVLKLLSSKISAPILEEIYTKYSTSAEKFAMRRELYGDLCKPLIPTNQELKFSDLLQQNPALAPSILVGLKSTLTKCLDKTWLLGSPIVLTVLCDYLNSCTEKDRVEMLEPLRSHVSAIIKNKVGADVGLIILKHSSAKEKKEIIKDMKGDIANIAVSPSGSVFLQHLIDSVDDTVLMKKALVPTVIENADEIIVNESGRKLISYIVAHRDGHFFHPSDINKLKMADDSAFVKKSAETRMKELQEACLPTLLSKIEDNPKLWLKDGCTCLLTASILQTGSGEKVQGAFQGIVDFIKNPDSRMHRQSKDSSDDVPAIEDAAINKILKKIIKDDSSRLEKDVPTFSEVLVSALDKETIDRWSSTNRGCFALVFLLESGVQKAVDDLKTKIASSKITKKLKNSEFKGAEILMGLLQ
ncbi:hypothetical protein GE061_005470 [Apolygus lucorum]|uniref:PUM-HD domain-containing protein n=1 Tax=Apolygus lucorum TaxID=248454 RepID=A0A8S9WWF9_APOLU|nr:hypothetical protein GE061_005470 [Apolygus lucorum]